MNLFQTLTRPVFLVQINSYFKSGRGGGFPDQPVYIPEKEGHIHLKAAHNWKQAGAP